MAQEWQIWRKGIKQPERVEILQDDDGQWFRRETAQQDWLPIDEPFDVEIYEGLRAVGMA